MKRSPQRSVRGFTLIELLIVVAIIGIIAAVAIPNLLQAINMARQKRSFSDLRTVTTALSIYAQDNMYYPRVGTANHLALEPYLGELPKRDGWANFYYYSANSTGTVFTIACYGSNRVPDLPYVPGPITRHTDDIVFTDGQLLQWPEGSQFE